MQTRTWTWRNKAAWGVGAWQAEPDKMQWQDTETGYPCLAKRNNVRVWCGYVGVAPLHPLYGHDYDSLEVDIAIHGGLTYSAFCNNEGAVEGICHIPEGDEAPHVWWFGFDCGHGGDLVPGLWEDGVYRTLAYAQEQCHRLAAQLKAFE